MSGRHRTRTAPPFLAATITAFVTVGLTVSGCEAEAQDLYVHCIDGSGRVVDPELCDDAEDDDIPGPYWYYLSPQRYGIGDLVPDDYVETRIDPDDEDARVSVGLPRSGKVAGTTIRVAGFGSGSSGFGGGGG